MLVGMQAGAAAAAGCETTIAGTEALAEYPAVRAFYDALTTGEAALADCAVSADWTNTPSASGMPAGPMGLGLTVQGVHATFSEYTFATQDVIADGNKVVVRSTLTAQQAGDFLGVPGGGDPVRFQTIDIHQLGEDGKIAQSWHVEDWLSFLLMRGALPVGQ